MNTTSLIPGHRAALAVIAAAAVLCLIAPPLAYWIAAGRAPSLDPAEARPLLTAPESPWRLVDVREPAEYAAAHVQGSLNWPLAAIEARGTVPPEWRRGNLILICDSGWLSARAALLLAGRGVPAVVNARGGIDAWQGLRCDDTRFCAMTTPGGETLFPFRAIPLYEQLVISIAAFGLKPAYMVLSLALALLLRRARGRDMAILAAALWAFFIGEAFCAVNYLFFGEGSYLIEYLHSAGMTASFGLAAWAIMEALDARVLHLSDRGRACPLLPLCRTCWKHDGGVCRATQLFRWLVLMALALCWMPLLAPLTRVVYNTDILGTWYTYGHPALYQSYEIRVLPVYAMIFFAAALVPLWSRRHDALALAKPLASLGAGFLGFSLFRLTLLALYRDSMTWFAAWEEITEFQFVVGVALALWFFRRGLFDAAAAATPTTGER